MTTATATLDVTAELNYSVDTGEKLVNETFGPGNIRRRSTGEYDQHRVLIRDGRPHAGKLSLDREGFIFVEHRTRMKDFFDPDQLKSVYYPEVVALVKSATGATRVDIFDHTLRSGDEDEREAKLIREPVLYTHNDYTEWSGPNRVRELFPDQAEELLKRRFAIVQVWRAIDRPILANPLAICDAGSVSTQDLLITERRYPHRVGQTYRIKYNPHHRWYYFPRMTREEAIVFKVFDSATDRARFTPHTSFADPNTPAGAPPRQSIEARMLAFF
jgi:hypothetical protein